MTKVRSIRRLMGQKALEAFAEDFSKHGKKALVRMREEDPEAYVLMFTGMVRRYLRGVEKRERAKRRKVTGHE